MATPNSTEGILAGAKRALANASKFTQSVEGNPTSTFAPHEYSKVSYKLPHEARKFESGGVIPGGNPNMAPELNEAQRMRGEAKKALNQ
jgi:hypothetical protein